MSDPTIAEQGNLLLLRAHAAYSSISDASTGLKAIAEFKAIAKSFDKLKAKLEAGEPLGPMSHLEVEQRQLWEASHQAAEAAHSIMRETKASMAFNEAVFRFGAAVGRFGQAAVKSEAS